MKGSPVDPERIYVSQTSGWFGQLLQASTDGGKTWFQPGVKPEDGRRNGRRSRATGSRTTFCTKPASR